ncbi:MAG: biotin/lipoyl-binding protein, partial [Pirellulales bacterium]
MNRLTWLSSVVLLAMAVSGLVPQAAWASDPVLEGCLVKLDDDIKVPAPEAGVLVRLTVKEGSQVRQGDVLANIYDEEV